MQKKLFGSKLSPSDLELRPDGLMILYNFFSVVELRIAGRKNVFRLILEFELEYRNTGVLIRTFARQVLDDEPVLKRFKFQRLTCGEQCDALRRSLISAYADLRRA